MKKPAHLAILSELQHSLNDIAGVLLGINGLGIHVPKKGLTEANVRLLAAPGHTPIIPHVRFLSRFGRDQ